MGRASTKTNKTVYQLSREKCDMTRDEASEALEIISKERIERIESRKNQAYPEEVLLMSRTYKDATLCNQHCALECPIGREYVPSVKLKELSQIVLEILASLNAMELQSNRLIDITVDGIISDAELQDFVNIQKKLEQISITVETLQLWAQSMLMSGKIDPAKYNALMRK